MFESWELYMNKASVMLVKVRSNKLLNIQMLMLSEVIC